MDDTKKNAEDAATKAANTTPAEAATAVGASISSTATGAYDAAKDVVRVQ